ncbi:MAG: hypothetical protein V2A73_15490 [Pseudomonadota bacterium]
MKLPEDASSGSCLLRISERAAVGVTDTSAGFFTIGTPPTGTIEITSPNGGEVWETRWRSEVTWTSTGPIDSVDIDISIDDGSTYRRLASAVPNTGSFLVNVPGLPSTECLLRITGVENRAISDTSDDTFVIVSRCLGLRLPNRHGCRRLRFPRIIRAPPADSGGVGQDPSPPSIPQTDATYQDRGPATYLAR